MKHGYAGVWLVAVAATLLSVTGVSSAEQVFLKRSDWLRKIGPSVEQESVLSETLAQLSPEDRVEFTGRLLKAIARMPVSPDAKAAAFVKAAVACIRDTSGELKNRVIAEVFAVVPVEFLPTVTDELAKRFNQEHNKLSDADYEAIAIAAVTAAVARNALTDEPSVRNAFVLAAFLRGAKNREALEPKLLALLPDARMRELVASWLKPAIEGNYEALLAAAAAEDLGVSNEIVIKLLGNATIDRLLAQMGMANALRDVVDAGFEMSPSAGGSSVPVDFGINRLPRRPSGYQNQSKSIRAGGSDASDGTPWYRF